ncbi:PepSY-associated TM helix domain-containing protein [Armatimonas sp.]|uniref:PepSY-associated TM helix domain-containing protein n=1 Tax=Armatimonas sp. TaxID=1872638 RepID=UPI00375307B6
MSSEKRDKAPRPLRLRIHSGIRWLHTYLSLVSLLMVLFFSITGLTLNHAEWIVGGLRQTEKTGQLPVEWLSGAEPKKLEIVEKLRSTFGVRGAVDEFRVDERECTVAFKGPGYAADAFVTRSTGALKLSVAEEGSLAALNDLHKGRHTSKTWAWVIDISAILLTLISLTGLGLLFYLKRIRTLGLIVVAMGAILLFVLARLALG